MGGLAGSSKVGKQPGVSSWWAGSSKVGMGKKPVVSSWWAGSSKVGKQPGVSSWWEGSSKVGRLAGSSKVGKQAVAMCLAGGRYSEWCVPGRGGVGWHSEWCVPGVVLVITQSSPATATLLPVYTPPRCPN